MDILDKIDNLNFDIELAQKRGSVIEDFIEDRRDSIPKTEKIDVSNENENENLNS
jgi:hypothetical protein